MAAEKRITSLLQDLVQGDVQAVQPLWEAYFEKLVGLARHRLRGAARRAADEEDVALSAFDSFCRRAQRGHFPQLNDRTDLWKLLVVFTARKAGCMVRREHRQKRGGGKVHDETTLAGGEAAFSLEQVIGREPTPQFAAEVAEECERRLSMLGDTELRQVAEWKLEGFSNEEIGDKLGCVPRTVDRKLHVIRALWSDLE